MNHQNQNKGISPRMFVSMLAVMLLLGCAVGGTIAWLTAQTAPVVNTFTVGDIDIELTETTGTNYKIVPGTNITKDPKVTVKADSEECYLFVKVEASAAMKKAFNNGAKWTIADGWSSLGVHIDNNTVVYYRLVNASDSNQVFNVLKDNTITVSGDLDAEAIAEINALGNCTLTFTAYAIQYEGFEDLPVSAWNAVCAAYAPAATATPAATTDPSDAPSEP